MSELKNIADDKFNQGEYEKAVELYTLCLDGEDTNKHFIYSNRCLTFIKLGKYTNALNDAKKIIKLKPDWAKGWARLGSCLELTNNNEKAEVAYKKAFELEPLNESYQKLSKLSEQEIKSYSNNFLNKDKNEFIDNIRKLKELKKDPKDLLIGDNSNKMIDKMLSNDKILNKIMDINFQQKIMSMSKNPMEALNDKETMDLMIEMMKQM